MYVDNDAVISSEEAKRAIALAQTERYEWLIFLLPRAQHLARSTLSGFKVGSICLGGNIEFLAASALPTLHAEQAAVLNAIEAGERSILRVATSPAPSGLCRQFLWEVNPHLMIPSPSGPALLSSLLSEPFDPSALGFPLSFSIATTHHPQKPHA